MNIQPNLNFTIQQGSLIDKEQRSQFLMPFHTELPTESMGCWERFKDGSGWILSKVVWFASIVGKVLLWPFQIVSGLAFKTLGVVWPEMAARAEALWGHLTLIGERLVAAFREEALLDDIQRLEEEKAILNTQVHNLAAQVQVIRVQKDHTVWEQQTTTEERNRARREIDERIKEKEQLIQEKDLLRNVNQQLQTSLDETTVAKDAAIAEKNAAILEKNRQRNEYDQVVQQAEILRRQLDQAGNNEELLQHFRRIDAAYEERRLQKEEEAQENMTELELEQLIPIYEAQKEAYQGMIQNHLNNLPEDDPLRTPMEGFIRIFNEELGHLRRISQEMHFYAELREPLKQLQQKAN